MVSSNKSAAPPVEPVKAGSVSAKALDPLFGKQVTEAAISQKLNAKARQKQATAAEAPQPKVQPAEETAPAQSEPGFIHIAMAEEGFAAGVEEAVDVGDQSTPPAAEPAATGAAAAGGGGSGSLPIILGGLALVGGAAALAGGGGGGGSSPTPTPTPPPSPPPPQNTAPTVANPIADQTINEDTAWSFAVPANAFTDAETSALTYTAARGDGSALPSWLTFNAGSRTFSGTPPQDFNGNIDLRVTASDGSLTASDTFRLTITPVSDPPVVSNPIADQSVNEDAAWSFTVPANAFTDGDGDTLTYAATRADGSALPAWLTFNASTRTFSGTPPENFNGEIELKVSASDGTVTVEDGFKLTIVAVNDAPVVNAEIEEQFVPGSSAWSFALSQGLFTDSDGDTLTYTATKADGSALPSWLGINSTTGTLSGTPPTDPAQSLVVKITASDGTASASTNVSLQLFDPAVPPVMTVTADTLVEGTATANTTTVVFSLSRPAEQDMAISYLTDPNTAWPGVDYVHAEGVVVIKAGERFATVQISSVPDSISETNKVFNLFYLPQDGDLQALAIAVNDDEARVQYNDPLYPQQWYLANNGDNGGVAGADINLIPLNGEYRGRGVSILVNDSGIDYNHPELVAAYDRTRDGGPTAPTDDGFPTIFNEQVGHGTFVAGFIAAQSNNGTGIVGIADNSSVTSYRILDGQSVFDASVGLLYSTEFDIANNSWGFIENIGYDDVFTETGRILSESVDYSVEFGRNGLGTVVVFAAGNQFYKGYDTNFFGLQSSSETITVAALDINDTYLNLDDPDEPLGFSTPGTSILVSAPGTRVLSTDMVGAAGGTPNDYAVGNGTSYAAPIVSAVVALMLEANPRLGYRDVMEILAYSARWNDRTDPSWQINAAENFNGGGLHFNRNYGFGAVNAHAAVRLAETWVEQQTAIDRFGFSVSSTNIGRIIPSGSEYRFNVFNDVDLQQTGIVFTGQIDDLSEMTISLVSPSGTESVLIFEPLAGSITPVAGNWLLASLEFWGEDPRGQWTLRIEDTGGDGFADGGFVQSLDLILVGSAPSDDDVYIFTNEFAFLSLQDPSRATLSDAQGIDTINASAVTGDVRINLNPGSESSIGGSSLKIEVGTIIENAFSGDGNDLLIGNAENNTLYGGRGSDTLYGAAGIDRLYGGQGRDYFVLLSPNDGTDLFMDFVFDSQTGDFIAIGADLLDFADLSNELLTDDEFAIRASLASMTDGDNGRVVVLTGAAASSDIEAGIFEDIDALVLLFNSNTQRAELWYDDDWSSANDRVQLAEFDNVTSLEMLQDVAASSFFAFG